MSPLYKLCICSHIVSLFTQSAYNKLTLHWISGVWRSGHTHPLLWMATVKGNLPYLLIQWLASRNLHVVTRLLLLEYEITGLNLMPKPEQPIQCIQRILCTPGLRRGSTPVQHLHCVSIFSGGYWIPRVAWFTRTSRRRPPRTTGKFKTFHLFLLSFTDYSF